MRGLLLLTIGVAALAAGSAFAAPVEYSPAESLYGVSFYDGPYVGGSIGAFNAGVISIDGRAGYNWSNLTDCNAIFGIEGEIGVVLPSNTFEAWGTGRVGMPLDMNTWVYGLGGIGVVNSGLSYRGGAGIEYAFTPSDRVTLDGLVQGGFGSAPTDFGIRLGYNRSLMMPPSTGPGWGGPMGGPWDLQLGGSATVVPTGGTPYFEAGVDVRALYDFTEMANIGLRGHLGVQTPGNSIVASGGVQLGIRPIDLLNLYGFGELGTIGSYKINVAGIGATYDITPNVSVDSEVFIRGGLGSFTESGFRLGLLYNVTPSEPDYGNPIRVPRGF